MQSWWLWNFALREAEFIVLWRNMSSDAKPANCSWIYVFSGTKPLDVHCTGSPLSSLPLYSPFPPANPCYVATSTFTTKTWLEKRRWSPRGKQSKIPITRWCLRYPLILVQHWAKKCFWNCRLWPLPPRSSLRLCPRGRSPISSVWADERGKAWVRVDRSLAPPSKQ